MQTFRSEDFVQICLCLTSLAYSRKTPNVIGSSGSGGVG